MGIKLGSTELSYGLILAPMAGVTDRTFRTVCSKHGAELSVSEMLSAKALCYEQKSHRAESLSSATAFLANVTKTEGPMSVQMFGREPSFMAEAAKMLEALSYKGCTSEVPPIAIDINMGCPVRKITSNGEGSALLKEPLLAGKICRAVVDAVKLPVTVKIRAGWDNEHKNAVEVARILEDSGASMICVHARTREQLYSPGIDMSVIKSVKSAVSIPVVGNGDVFSADDALQMLEQTGCDGVMIGRGAMGNPWIFSQIRSALEGKDIEYPTVDEKIKTARDQLDAMIAHKGERVGIAEGKKHVCWYISGLRGAAEARDMIMRAADTNQIEEILTDLIIKNK